MIDAYRRVEERIVQPLLRELDGHVETWTLNRPESRNAITDGEMIDAVEQAAAEANASTVVRCIILTGTGTAFSSGGNLNDIATGKGYFGMEPYPQSNGYRTGIQRIPKSIYSLDVPIVAAVNGPAVGAGCDLALMCDVRVASNTAFFAESFVKLGLVPGDGGAWFLPRIVGYARAAEMTLTGGRVKADKALEWGLVSQVVAPEDLLAAARVIADEIAANPPHATRMAKRLLRESERQSLESLLDMSATMQSLAHHTKDHKEAITAALEKRTATFTGE